MVTEIGNNAIVRSTGVSTSQQTSASQEAKDFKVVVTLQDPPENLRPGLSATAKITTATRSNALAIPIQALTVRQQAETWSRQRRKTAVQAAAPNDEHPIRNAIKKKFRVCLSCATERREFVPVHTGIAGTTDIEVLSGLRR